MQNNMRRYIHACIFLLLFIILFILMIFDVKNFYQNNHKRNKNKLDNSIAIEDVYTELSRNIKQKNKNYNTKDTREEQSELSKIGETNIFSTNPWRIKIPKLRLDAPITEGTSKESLRRTVGHFAETTKWKGNVCLAGHNRGYRCNFFGEIKTLKKGDIIIYCTKRGEMQYKVIANTVIKETDWTYLEDTKDNRITLITCEINRREYRRCIQAVEVKDI